MTDVHAGVRQRTRDTEADAVGRSGDVGRLAGHILQRRGLGKRRVPAELPAGRQRELPAAGAFCATAVVAGREAGARRRWKPGRRGLPAWAVRPIERWETRPSWPYLLSVGGNRWIGDYRVSLVASGALLLRREPARSRRLIGLRRMIVEGLAAIRN